MMDALVEEICRLPHLGDCTIRKRGITGRCSCGLDNLLCRAVTVKADTLIEISKCRTQGLRDIGELLAHFRDKAFG